MSEAAFCHVRKATDSDAAALLRIAESAIATLRQTYRPTPAAIARKKTSADRLTRLVGEIDGRVAGSVEYRIEEDRVHFRSLFVHEDFRRRRVGSRLIDELERIGRQHGLRCLSAYTIAQTGNPGIFERLGFDVVSQEPADFCESDRFDDLTEVYMERAIK